MVHTMKLRKIVSQNAMTGSSALIHFQSDTIDLGILPSLLLFYLIVLAIKTFHALLFKSLDP